MSSQKTLIIPWLLSKIGDPNYPGLTWTNPEKTEFRIPWKCKRRHDWSDVDVKIFKDWAIKNGRYRPGIDEPKPDIWKRNLRAALYSKSEVEMIENNNTDDNEPHKVYRIISQFSRAGQQTTEESQRTDDGPTFDSSCLGADPCDLFDLSAVHRELQPLTNPLPVPVQDQAPQETYNLEQFFPNNTLVTDFDVHIYYRGDLVKNTTVQNPRGMRFTSSSAPGTRPELEDIVLPEPSMVSDHEVRRMINHVLHSLEPGLMLEVEDRTIYGIRHGNCRGFWTMTEFPPVCEIKEVRKNEYTPMYTLQQYVTELIGFIQRTRKESPLYSIWLSLGDLWPDPGQKPWTKKFIMVKVTPVLFRMLHEMSHSTGASSLSSSEMNLQISDSLSSRELLNLLQELEEKMEIEFGC